MSDDRFIKQNNKGGSCISSDCMFVTAAISCCLLSTIGFITYIVYLGIYAFDNPDPTDCWYLSGSTVGQTSREAAI